MHELGIMIVAGTDAPNAGLNFGSDLFKEMKLYQQAGMSNLEVLKTATGNAAKTFDIPVGMLKVGSKANMVMLKANPLENLEALKEIEAIWKNGAAEEN